METFDINRFFKVFLHSKFYIILILLLCFVIGYFYSYHYVTPMYQSSATVVLVRNAEQETLDDSSITQTDIALNKNLLATYTQIAKNNKVLEQVIKNLNLNITPEQLASLVSVQSINNTEVFKISVANTDNLLAASITNNLLEVFIKEVNSLYNMNNIYIMDKAEVSHSPYNINHTKDFTMFAMIGILLSFACVVIIYLLDNTVKSEKDIEDFVSLSVLSTIPVYINKSGKHNSELIVNEQPKSPIAECFKTFRTNVMFSIQNKKLNTILVTSGFMGEGKSFVSSNLAIAFANSGKKVILVDTDMRKGRTHKIFDLSNENGLSNCLAKIGISGKELNINQFIQESTFKNLHVMTSGIVPPNPSELLSSSSMIRLLEALNRQYDVVICDGTPCMLVSDSVILSKIVDTTVIVTASKTTKLDALLKIKKSIEMVGGNIGGVVINKMDIASKSYKNNYYYGEHCSNDVTHIANVAEHDVTLDSPLFVRDLPQVVVEGPKPEAIEKELSSDSFSHIILNELQQIKEEYNSLNQKLDSIKTFSLSNEIVSKLEDRVDALEKRYIDNELLVQNLSDEVRNHSYNSKQLDINKLNNKVIQLRDYLETSNKKTISDFIDAHVPIEQEHTEDTVEKVVDKPEVASFLQDTNYKSAVVDYETVKRKQSKKGFSFFKGKSNVVPKAPTEEAPIAIVSQILSNNKKEDVG